MPVVAELSTLVHTAVGDLRGALEGGAAVWRGVQYAQQPVDERRFAAPAPLSPWTGVRDAIEHGPLPLQGRSFIGGGRNDPKVRDEACLTVTVWSPDTSGSLPVMVWIPGGSVPQRRRTIADLQRVAAGCQRRRGRRQRDLPGRGVRWF